ncbi:MAG TPA: hypothetical protein VN688_01820 [Gemmataceae bacterium]|nr:hypothetical protein [Gemmataceae bacterium]
MKTILSSLLLLVSLALPGTSSLYATDPAPSPPKGKVLILKNEHTMEGDIERVGDRYRLRRLTGETWVPMDRVLCVVGTLPDAYAYLRGRANLEDADERLRLANWCRLNGLREQALAEIQVAAALRPDHAETRRILQHLRQASQTSAAPKSPTPAPDKPTPKPMPSVEVTTDSLGLFATRVQPILMNTCARCHATGRGGQFQLTQVYDDGLTNRRTLERNLAAVLGQINLNQPESSRLLAKAISDHAHTGQAPLKSRQETPYRTLENWVKLTVANNPHLRETQPVPAKSLMLPTPERRSATAESKSEWGAEARPSSTPVSPALPGPSSVPVPVSSAAAASPPPPPPATPADPYDPELFNQRLHPETTKPAPGK